jgi:mRNA-degrading endonuclease RelE of RelBE toxin-antitoxin system
MKARVKVNKSLDKKLERLEQTAEERVKDELVDVAQFAVSRSPVDTGAYVTSFSIKNSYSSGRSRTSRNKPRRQSPQAKREEGLSQMLGDIETLKPLEEPLIVISNGSPHATQVEKLHGYAVFAQIRNKFQ